jgi:prepilin-type N-terminal cleavage/methylation domain-containing protein/prepilin-type processing-associated H-X9-DG protein
MHKRAIRARRGFTLVELLVVIGIIAILVGVLLPSLVAARRAGMSVKCKAALHQIGDAFKMYSVENRGWWPMVKWHPLPGSTPAGAPETLTWQDFLFKYLHRGKDLPIGPFKSDISGVNEIRSDLSQVRFNSPFWGCPAFNGQEYFNPSDDVARYSTGYGMQYYPAAPFPSFGYAVTTAGIATLAVFDAPPGTVRGRFWKGTDWNKNGANRLIVADANQYWIYTSSAQHYKSNFTCEPYFDTTLSGTFVRLDAARHLGTSGLSLKKVLRSKGFNVLFADGHVDGQTPFEAYNSTMGGGYDILAP